MDLQSGQNAAVGAGPLRVGVSCDPSQQAPSLDASAFLLDARGRVSGDDGFVFYGQPAHPSGAISLAHNGDFTVTPGKVPAGIERIVLAWSIDTDVAGLRTFSQFRSVTLQCDALRFALATGGMSESALIMGELYQRNGVWKLRALGQGFAGGLAPLARNYGVDVEQKTPPEAPRASPSTPPPSGPAPAPPAPAAQPSRIDLKKREPISLEKPAKGFGEIRVNLNWSRGTVKKGFFGGSSGGIDLDLGCMVELRDGRKDVVQALGNTFGRLDSPPFAKLLGDDRTGDSSSGETLLINGERWNDFKRVLIYAFIYEGAVNWAAANGVVTVTAPGSPELVVRMDEHATGKGMCAIAMLENDGGRIRVSKLVEYFSGHRDVDQNYGFGFRWQRGSK